MAPLRKRIEVGGNVQQMFEKQAHFIYFITPTNRKTHLTCTILSHVCSYMIHSHSSSTNPERPSTAFCRAALPSPPRPLYSTSNFVSEPLTRKASAIASMAVVTGGGDIETSSSKSLSRNASEDSSSSAREGHEKDRGPPLIPTRCCGRPYGQGWRRSQGRAQPGDAGLLRVLHKIVESSAVTNHVVEHGEPSENLFDLDLVGD